jgi:hypothetical protein
MEVQLHSFLTSAPDGDEVSVTSPAALSLGKQPPVLMGQEAGWAPELVWTRQRRKRYMTLLGVEPQSSSVASHYTNYPASTLNPLKPKLV